MVWLWCLSHCFHLSAGNHGPGSWSHTWSQVLAFKFHSFYRIFLGLGITAGAHRLWSHKTFKAKFPLRVFLVVANSMAGENSIFIWSRDHRTHHKFSETDADPHNAKVNLQIKTKFKCLTIQRGFFFSHIGWLCVRKHPKVISAGKTINMTDLASDSLIMFQHNHYMLCFLSSAFILPTLIPALWGESLVTAYFIAGMIIIYLVVYSMFA